MARIDSLRTRQGQRGSPSAMAQRISKLNQGGRYKDPSQGQPAPQSYQGTKGTPDYSQIKGFHPGIVKESATARKALPGTTDPTELAALQAKIAKLQPIAKQVREARAGAGQEIKGLGPLAVGSQGGQTISTAAPPNQKPPAHPLPQGGGQPGQRPQGSVDPMFNRPIPGPPSGKNQDNFQRVPGTRRIDQLRKNAQFRRGY